MKNTITLFILLFFSGYISAQGFGQHPTGLNWQVVNTPNSNVIFPKGMESQAMRIANVLDYQKENAFESVGLKLRKINVVLQNQTVVTNGNVSLAPFRSNFFSTPFEEMRRLGAVDWMDVLSIHEYRHVQQITNTDTGITRFLHALQGEEFWTASVFLGIPRWYFEGDAVTVETALTGQGRGRTPFFTLQQRALALADQNFSYQKVSNGSFKDNIPNEYPLGYMMLTHLRKEKGNNITQSILKDAGAYKGILYPFTQAMKRHTGYHTHELYHKAWAQSKTYWKDQLEATEITPTTFLTPKPNKTITNYFFPQEDEQGNLIAQKRSYKKIDQIVYVSPKGEEKIIATGLQLTSYFNANQNQLTWTEVGQNPRRNNQTYANIFHYDIAKGERKKLTQNGKYFSPIISNDGKQVYAIQLTPKQICSIESIDVESKEQRTIVEFAPDEFVVRPSVVKGQDNLIVYLLKKGGNLSIWKYDFSTSVKSQITPWTKHMMDGPRAHGEYVYYVASFSGIDNIYRSPLDESQRVEQLTSVPLGAYDPSVSADGNTLLFVEHTDRGRVISSLNLDATINKKISPEIHDHPIEVLGMNELLSQLEGGEITDKIPAQQYTVNNYKGLFKDLKLHSWNLSPSLSTPELSLLFDNYLGDVSTEIYGGYNRNEKGAYYGAELSIGKWYPEINLSGEFDFREADYLPSNADTLSIKTFNEAKVGVEIAIPNAWIVNNYRTSFKPSVSINQHIVSNQKIAGTLITDVTKSYNSVVAGFEFSTIRRKAIQNLAPKFGFNTTLEYTSNLNSNDNQKLSATAKLYLPGLVPNHSLRISGGYQKELLSNTFQYSDGFEYLRGFEAPINDEFSKFSIEYAFPIAYPDWGFAGITYFKRISANLFYDHGQAKFLQANTNNTFRSAGLEIVFDNTLMNVLPFRFGIRGTYLLDEDPFNVGKKFRPSFFVIEEF